MSNGSPSSDLSVHDGTMTLRSGMALIQATWDDLEKIEANKEKIRDLLDRCERVFEVVRRQLEIIILNDRENAIRQLIRHLKSIKTMVQHFSRLGLAKSLLRREEIAGQIVESHHRLTECLVLFHVPTAHDLHHYALGLEQARASDDDYLRKLFGLLKNSDSALMDRLEVSRNKRESMVALHNNLQASSEMTVEREIVAGTLASLQRSTGKTPKQLQSKLPPEWTITSFDVDIDHSAALGSGGFGAVWKGKWGKLVVAVKEVKEEIDVKLILREIKVWSQLRHNHVLQFYGASLVAEPPFLISRFMKNGNIVRYLTSINPHANRVQLAHEIAVGMHFIHSRGIVHGDLKGVNVLIDDSCQACITDFGLSRIRQISRASQTVRLSQNGYVSTFTADGVDEDLAGAGTPRYMSPEAMLGTISKESDVYAYAMTLYEIFTDEQPFARVPENTLFILILKEHQRVCRPTAPEAEDRGLTPNMWSLIWNASDHEAARRPNFTRICDITEDLAAEWEGVLRTRQPVHNRYAPYDIFDIFLDNQTVQQPMEQPIALGDLGGAQPVNAVMLYSNRSRSPSSSRGHSPTPKPNGANIGVEGESSHSAEESLVSKIGGMRLSFDDNGSQTVRALPHENHHAEPIGHGSRLSSANDTFLAATEELSVLPVTVVHDLLPPHAGEWTFPGFVYGAEVDANGMLLVNDAASPHLASWCLDTMLRLLQRNPLRIEDSSIRNKDIEDLAEKVEQVLSSPLQYACRHWAVHLSLTTPRDAELLDRLNEFMFKCLLWWIEAMSLMSMAEHIVECLELAREWAVESSSKSNLASMLSHAYQFTLAYSDIIRGSAQHIYRSALPFTPRRSLFYNTYEHEADTVKVVRGSQQAWPDYLGVWRGHTDAVQAVAFSPDGQYLASASADQTIRMWHAVSGAPMAALKGHSGSVTSIAFSPDGTRMASASHDNTSRANTVFLWDTESVSVVFEFTDHTDWVQSVVFSPDGTQLASASCDETVRMRHVESGALMATLKRHKGAVTSVAFSPDGLRLASASKDESVRLWCAIRGVLVATLRGHSDSVRSVAFSPDGSLIASASNDKTIIVWDATSGALTATLTGHSGWVTSITFSPDGSSLASASHDRQIRLWDIESGVSTSVLKGHSDGLTSVVFSPDGSRLASSSQDKTIRTWDTASIASSEALNRESVTSTTLTRRSSSWASTSGRSFGTPHAHSGTVRCVLFSPDGLYLASASHDQTIRLWDATSGSLIACLEDHSGCVTSVAFSPDGARLASASHDKKVRLWDLASETPIYTFKDHSDWVRSVAFSPDGLSLASASDDNTIRLWPVSGASMARVIPLDEPAHSVIFSPDGSQLASADDYNVNVWNSGSGSYVAEYAVRNTSIKFSPDGLWLSCQDGATLKSIHHTSGAVTEDLRSLPLSQRVVLVGNSLMADHHYICRIPSRFTVKCFDVTQPESSADGRCRVALGCHGGEVIILDISAALDVLGMS